MTARAQDLNGWQPRSLRVLPQLQPGVPQLQPGVPQLQPAVLQEPGRWASWLHHMVSAARNVEAAVPAMLAGLALQQQSSDQQQGCLGFRTCNWADLEY